MWKPVRPKGLTFSLHASLHGLVALALFGWAFATFDAARPHVGVGGDEQDWLATTRYFRYLFLEGDLAHEEWGENYWTLTHPPVFRYVLGAGLWLQGHDLSNVRRRNWAPTEAMRMDARRVTALYGAGAIALLYVVAVQLGAPLGGLVAALLAGASPYLRQHFVRASAESTLAFFLLAVLVLCLVVFRRPSNGFSLRSGALAGLVLALAVGSKLTAILSGPPLGLACLGATLAARARGERRDGWRPLAWGCTLALACWGLVVVLNPFLWPDPLGRTAAMLRHRQDQIRLQQKRTPEAAVHDPRDRPALVLAHALVNRTWANTTLRLPLDVPLAAVGLVSLGATALRDWRGARQIGPSALVLLWLLSYLVGIT